MYVTTPEDVFISRDGGAHWVPGNLLPVRRSDQQPWAVAVNPNNPLQAYVGTQNAGLWVTTNGGLTWSRVATRNVSGDWFRAITTDGQDVVVATDRGVWISRDAAQNWQPFIGQPAVPSVVLGLTMPAQSGRFLMALGESGIGDADVSSDVWFAMADPPPASFVNSVSAVGEAFYAGSDRGLLCNRLWSWTEINWWRSHLGVSAPCPRN
jgi:hypothetical protein